MFLETIIGASVYLGATMGGLFFLDYLATCDVTPKNIAIQGAVIIVAVVVTSLTSVPPVVPPLV
jgi:hypothetical protein